MENEGQDHTGNRAQGQEGYPAPDFRGFIAGLYAQTLMAMGYGNDGGKQADLAEAQFLIDTIVMIEEKTRGNLTGEEEGYVREVLNDLRMRYVTRKRAQKNGEADSDKGEKED